MLVERYRQRQDSNYVTGGPLSDASCLYLQFNCVGTSTTASEDLCSHEDLSLDVSQLWRLIRWDSWKMASHSAFGMLDAHLSNSKTLISTMIAVNWLTIWPRRSWSTTKRCDLNTYVGIVLSILVRMIRHGNLYDIKPLLREERLADV